MVFSMDIEALATGAGENVCGDAEAGMSGWRIAVEVRFWFRPLEWWTRNCLAGTARRWRVLLGS